LDIFLAAVSYFLPASRQSAKMGMLFSSIRVAMAKIIFGLEELVKILIRNELLPAEIMRGYCEQPCKQSRKLAESNVQDQNPSIYEV
jgi:hypothetical protein